MSLPDAPERSAFAKIEREFNFDPRSEEAKHRAEVLRLLHSVLHDDWERVQARLDDQKLLASWTERGQDGVEVWVRFPIGDHRALWPSTAPTLREAVALSLAKILGALTEKVAYRRIHAVLDVATAVL